MANILIVEDEKSINDLISMNLKLVGHNFKKTYDGYEALKEINENNFDLILLDVMVPNIDGFELAKKIQHRKIPIIFITAKTSLSDKIYGFELGAEDYVTKPFEILELLARINVILKRYKLENDIFIFNDIEIRFSERKIFKNNKELEITLKEFDLLETLIKNKNIVLSREKLLQIVWGYDFEGDTRTVDVHILKLRKKIGLEENIKTVYKLGYRLEI